MKSGKSSLTAAGQRHEEQEELSRHERKGDDREPAWDGGEGTTSKERDLASFPRADDMKGER